jgi:hypothetical protein
MTRFATVLAIITLALSGCATYVWYNPNKTPQQRDSDILACERESLQMYPQRFENVEVQAAKVEPEKTTCTTKGNTTNCTTYPAKRIPAVFEKQDVNSGRRSEATSRCMGAKGYRWVEEKKKQ